MSVVAITGCSGYLGSRLLRILDESEEVSRVIGVDLNPPRVSSTKLDFHRMDVRDPSIINLFTLNDVQTVVHLAYVFNPIRDEDLEYDIDVNGTRNVLAATSACVAKHLVVASSTTAFGALPDNPDWLTENDPPRRQRNFMYASNKYENELIVRIFKQENPHVKVAVVRPCIVLGPNVDNFVSRFILKLPVLPAVGDTGMQMQFVHEDDAAEVFIRVLEKGVEGYFHACGEGTVSVEEIARMAGKTIIPLPAKVVYPLVDLLWKLHAPLIEAPSGMLDFIRYRWTASDEVTQETLGLGPRMHSREVVRLMLESHGKRPS